MTFKKVLIRESLCARFASELLLHVVLDMHEEPLGAGQLRRLAHAGKQLQITSL